MRGGIVWQKYDNMYLLACLGMANSSADGCSCDFHPWTPRRASQESTGLCWRPMRPSSQPWPGVFQCNTHPSLLTQIQPSLDCLGLDPSSCSPIKTNFAANESCLGKRSEEYKGQLHLRCAGLWKEGHDTWLQVVASPQS